MPRIPYATPSERVSALLERRRGGSMTPLDRLLAHHEGFAEGWNALLGSVREQFSIPGDIREMIILRVGRLNYAPYEWDAHYPIAIAEGLPEEVLGALESNGRAPSHPAHDAVLAYVDASTRAVTVPDSIFEELQKHFSDSEIVEVTGVIASYNMVSRFLVALDVQTADRQSAGATTACAAEARS